MSFKLLLFISAFQIGVGFSPTSSISTFPHANNNVLSSPHNKLTYITLSHKRSSSRRNLPIMKSAKILPIIYTSASAALVYQAKQTTSKLDAAFLLATSALTLFNLGPTDNKRLISAKRANANNPPAVSGIAKQRRQFAKTCRSTVRIKIVGQLIGLAMMICNNGNIKLRGGAMIMGANMAFFLCGGGGAVHNIRGDHEPLPSGLTRFILMIDIILTLSALFAARAPLESSRRAVYMGIHIAGVSWAHWKALVCC